MKKETILSIQTKKNFIYTLSLLLFSLFFNTSIQSQETSNEKSFTVKGIVKDADDFPLPGASIQLKNTIKGAETNDKGEFEITNIKEGDILAFYFTGYKPQEISIKKSQTTINVIMISDSTILNDVVVVGAGDSKATYKTKRSFWKRVAAIF